MLCSNVIETKEKGLVKRLTVNGNGLYAAYLSGAHHFVTSGGKGTEYASDCCPLFLPCGLLVCEEIVLRSKPVDYLEL